MENNTFNILNQLVQEQKSLWRIERHYLAEAKSDEEKAVWEELKEHKLSSIEKLQKLM